jgi:hypothetical protein
VETEGERQRGGGSTARGFECASPGDHIGYTAPKILNNYIRERKPTYGKEGSAIRSDRSLAQRRETETSGLSNLSGVGFLEDVYFFRAPSPLPLPAGGLLVWIGPRPLTGEGNGGGGGMSSTATRRRSSSVTGERLPSAVSETPKGAGPPPIQPPNRRGVGGGYPPAVGEGRRPRRPVSIPSCRPRQSHPLSPSPNPLQRPPSLNPSVHL